MKYLRSLMQQSVTACKNQAKLIQQFTLSLLYLLIIHIVALLFFFLFRLVLFTSIDYQFPPDIQNNGSPDKPGGLSIQLCKSEKKEFYIRYSS